MADKWGASVHPDDIEALLLRLIIPSSNPGERCWLVKSEHGLSQQQNPFPPGAFLPPATARRVARQGPKDGYARVHALFRGRRRRMTAQRFMAVLYHGLDPDLSPDRRVIQICGHPRCCNPAHLEVLDRSAAAARASQRPGSRLRRGQRHPAAKLHDRTVAAIRRARGRVPARELAERFSCSVHTVYSLWGRRRRDYGMGFPQGGPVGLVE